MKDDMLIKTAVETVQSTSQGLNALGDGEITVKTTMNSYKKGIVLETTYVNNSMNNIVQFDIDNTGGGSTDQIVRVGSEVNEPDAFAKFGLVPGASDNGVIKDDFGVGCLKIQGFTSLCNGNNVVLDMIKISTSDLTQLAQSITYNYIHYDMTVYPRTKNVGFTQEKSDDRLSLLVMKGRWILDPQEWIEYTVKANKSVTLFLRIVGINASKIFVPLASEV